MPEKKGGASLKVIVAGVVQALREAKLLGDMESAKLVQVYKKEEALSSFTVPAFTISDVDVELRFSVVEPIEEQEKKGEVLDLKVNISSESLKGLEAHHVSLMKFKLSPVNFRVLEEGK